MLVQRIITALAFGVLVVSLVFFLPPIYFDLLAISIVALAFWEFSGFFLRRNQPKKVVFLAAFLAICWVVKFLPVIPILMIGSLWWLVAPCFLWRYLITGHNYFTNIAWQFFVGIMIFVPCLVGLIDTHKKFGPIFLLYLISIICSADIGGYFAGRFLGRNLLVPRISPKKTIEGLVGGVILSLLVTTIWLLMFNGIGAVNKVTYYGDRVCGTYFLVLSVVANVFSVIGDLFESMLKRQAGVKDSGQILPGHGGMYDRIDSLTAAIPVFVLLFLIIYTLLL